MARRHSGRPRGRRQVLINVVWTKTPDSPFNVEFFVEELGGKVTSVEKSRF